MSEWIDVRKKLPDNGEWVFASVIEHGVCLARVIGEYDNRPNWSIVPKYCAQFKSTNAVTHWMPAPEAPQIEKDNARRCATCGLWDMQFDRRPDTVSYCEHLGIGTRRDFCCICWEPVLQPSKMETAPFSIIGTSSNQYRGQEWSILFEIEKWGLAPRTKNEAQRWAGLLNEAWRKIRDRSYEDEQ